MRRQWVKLSGDTPSRTEGSPILEELKRTGRTMTLWHGTTDIFLASILKGGILSPLFRQTDKFERRTIALDQVFLTVNKGFAERMAITTANKENGKPILLEVEVPIWKLLETRILVEHGIPQELQDYFNEAWWGIKPKVMTEQMEEEICALASTALDRIKNIVYNWTIERIEEGVREGGTTEEDADEDVEYCNEGKFLWDDIGDAVECLAEDYMDSSKNIGYSMDYKDLKEILLDALSYSSNNPFLDYWFNMNFVNEGTFESVVRNKILDLLRVSRVPVSLEEVIEEIERTAKQEVTLFRSMPAKWIKTIYLGSRSGWVDTTDQYLRRRTAMTRDMMKKIASASDAELYHAYCLTPPYPRQQAISMRLALAHELVDRGFFKSSKKKKKGPGRGSRTPKYVKDIAEKLKEEPGIEEPFALAQYVRERHRAKGKIKGETKHERADYEEVKELAGD